MQNYIIFYRVIDEDIEIMRVIRGDLRDFQNAKESLGLQVMTPAQLIIKLASKGTEP